ncbi:TetR/AcrR family transcriptional regulator [Paractinoplanes globisporus]|uniref:TetR family transcriptional regulator n=1 Tax=Paractinoplanes globisporus TaxID=113565 RepID=A0ABW6WAM5_9ACTN|nr:TetR/AcrR family transcriptional regulator [Actinoplanes globisporus]
MTPVPLPFASSTGSPASPASGPRRRDAAKTRQLLLDAARRRFAEDGYAATTVRDIADDAGVNVALISRYFASKEGLFEACLKTAGEELRRSTGEVGLDGIPEAIARHIAESSAGSVAGQLALLLRSSGDERADQIRLDMLRSSAGRLAALAGDGPDRLLRAEVVLAAAIGITLLRTSTGIEPLSSAGVAELTSPLRDLVGALLGDGSSGAQAGAGGHHPE